MNMHEIDKLTNHFAGTRLSLAAELQTLRDEQEAAKRIHLRALREKVARFTAAHDALKDALEASPGQFKRPKTRVLHGIKVGYMKRRGKIDLGDSASVVKLIRKHFPNQFDALVKSTESPVRAALANLSAADLKRIGVRVTEDVDAVLIKGVDRDLDKLLDALLNDQELEEIR